MISLYEWTVVVLFSPLGKTGMIESFIQRKKEPVFSFPPWTQLMRKAREKKYYCYFLQGESWKINKKLNDEEWQANTPCIMCV